MLAPMYICLRVSSEFLTYPLRDEVAENVLFVGWYIINVITVIRLRVTTGNSRLCVCVFVKKVER